MSRSIKDLRELVCVSRLTMREDDGEEEEDLSRPLTSLSLFEERPTEGPDLFFNSGHGSTNGGSSTLYNPSIEVHQTTLGKTKHVENINNNSASLEARIEFSKQKSCLPPVRSSSQRPSSGDSQSLANERQGFYDDVLKYLDEESVSSWLHQANQSVTELTNWCQQGENFVGFCHFWLTEFSLDEQLALVKLEIGVLLDEIGFALRNAISGGKIREADVKTLFSSLLPEYPGKLCSPRGQYVFLNILNTLSSGKTEGYKKLLTNVKLHTRQSDIAQRALSTRAYIVINLWKNVTQFYVNVKSVTRTEEKAKETRPQTPGKENTHLDNYRIFQAVRRGNVRVLHYMLSNSCGSPSTKDGRGQSLALAAVLNNQARILKYLLTKHSDNVSLDEPCDSGNTPLHVAANLNHTECLQLLLQSGSVNVNEKNLQCEGATPLHLAVMQGNKESITLLLEAGADRGALMNGVSPLTLAEQLDLEEIMQLLVE